MLLFDFLSRDTIFPAGALVATTGIIVDMATGIPWCCCQKAVGFQMSEELMLWWDQHLPAKMRADILFTGSVCCWALVSAQKWTSRQSWKFTFLNVGLFSIFIFLNCKSVMNWLLHISIIAKWTHKPGTLVNKNHCAFKQQGS